ncbi:unnamed protein product, partial [Discosporangium mesarthrocarpum]
QVIFARLPGRPGGQGRLPLVEALGRADYVSLHCPLTDDTLRSVVLLCTGWVFWTCFSFYFGTRYSRVLWSTLALGDAIKEVFSSEAFVSSPSLLHCTVLYYVKRGESTGKGRRNTRLSLSSMGGCGAELWKQ